MRNLYLGETFVNESRNFATYLSPWLGYFDLIDQVDAFVILDTVQFERQSWQQRNRIKTPIGLQWLTVPVFFRGRLGQIIKDVEIRESGFGRDHLRAIELNYRRTPYFENYFDQLGPQIRCSTGARLVDINVRLMEWLMSVLGIQTKLLFASQLNQQGKRTELLANICISLGSTTVHFPCRFSCLFTRRERRIAQQEYRLIFSELCAS